MSKLSLYLITIILLFFQTACIEKKKNIFSENIIYTDTSYSLISKHIDKVCRSEYLLNGTILWKNCNFGVDKTFTGYKINYYPDGSIKDYTQFMEGALHGKFLSFYENGALSIEANYHLGCIHGYIYNYTDIGDLIEFREFNCGNTVFKRIYDADTIIEYVYPEININHDSVFSKDTFTVSLFIHVENFDTTDIDIFFAVESLHSVTNQQLDSLYLFDPEYTIKTEDNCVQIKYVALEVAGKNRNVIYGYPFFVNRLTSDTINHPFFRHIFYIYDR